MMGLDWRDLALVPSSSRWDTLRVPPCREIPSPKEGQMEGPAKERWLELCELAAIEQDRDKLLALMREINRLLEEKEQRLKAKKPINT